MGTPLTLEKSDMGCTLCQQETVLQGVVDYSILGEQKIPSGVFQRRLYVWQCRPEANESWTCNTSGYCGNPSTSEKCLPYAYEANLRLHLSHPLGKVKKKERNCKECKARTRNYPELKQPRSAAGRGHAGGDLHNHKTQSKLSSQSRSSC